MRSDLWNTPRVGIIIKYPQNGLFQDLVNVYFVRFQTLLVCAALSTPTLVSTNLCLGLTNKKDYVSQMITVNKIDICCMQEIDVKKTMIATC